MSKCIYLGENSQLTFNSQEHVIPASLGCVDKLPIGAVSDQANNIFSKYELELFRNTPIGFITKRNIGERGNLNKPISELVCEFERSDDIPKIYVSILDKTYNIAQLIIFENTYELRASDVEEATLLLSLIKKVNKDTRFNFRLIPNCKEDILIVVYCNKKWYCYHSKIINETNEYSNIVGKIVFVASQIPDKLDGIERTVKKIPKDKEIVVGKIFSTDSFISQDRVIIKMMINTICYLFGEDKATDILLDNMKQFALGTTDTLNNVLYRKIELWDERVVLHPHRVKFYYNEKWHCGICLFDELYFDYELPIDLSEFIKSNESKEYIVDWQNKLTSII